jgi:hypothetical protein
LEKEKKKKKKKKNHGPTTTSVTNLTGGLVGCSSVCWLGKKSGGTNLSGQVTTPPFAAGSTPSAAGERAF